MSAAPPPWLVELQSEKMHPVTERVMAGFPPTLRPPPRPVVFEGEDAVQVQEVKLDEVIIIVVPFVQRTPPPFEVAVHVLNFVSVMVSAFEIANLIAPPSAPLQDENVHF